MINDYWNRRGKPWEYDPGPPRNRRWPRLFAETPNYRGLSDQYMGKEKFRWHFGPMFYRGRLNDNAVKVVIVGQEGAQDESLSHRSFTGGTGARMQHFLNYLGITRSYLFLNTFAYPIFGQYGSKKLRWLAQDPASPIVKHRQEIFNYVLKRNDVNLIIAVGRAAKESIVTWVESRGGSCPQGSNDVSKCSGSDLDHHTRIIGVRHPGGAGSGGTSSIKADFIKALNLIKQWMDADPTWLPPDEDGVRGFDQSYKYKSAPIPFRDFPIGVPWRLGRGGTSSNRKDQQRSIQIFSASGKYNNRETTLLYADLSEGSSEGYREESKDLPYEPPKKNYRQFDRGPGKTFAKLMMGGKPGFTWPDFSNLSVTAHASFGYGPIYRGRPSEAFVLILADQQSYDDLFTMRALCGDSGQRVQAYLESIGIRKGYVILRILPVDTTDLHFSSVRSIVNNPQTRKVYQAIVNEVIRRSKDLSLLLCFGSHAKFLAQKLALGNLQTVKLKAWKQSGALPDWKNKLSTIQVLNYEKDISNPTFAYNGERGQIPRFDLPYGFLRWQGTSGNRARRPSDQATGELSPDYYKLYMPDWAYQLAPRVLSKKEQAALDNAP